MADWIVLHPANPKWPEAYVIVNLDQVLIISPLGPDKPGTQLVFEGGREVTVRNDPRTIARLPRVPVMPS